MTRWKISLLPSIIFHGFHVYLFQHNYVKMASSTTEKKGDFATSTKIPKNIFYGDFATSTNRIYFFSTLSLSLSPSNLLLSHKCIKSLQVSGQPKKLFYLSFLFFRLISQLFFLLSQLNYIFALILFFSQLNLPTPQTRK